MAPECNLKKILKGFAAAAIILGLAGAAVMLDTPPTALFGGKVIGLLEDPVTSGMFVSEDTDVFSPGLPIGARFPSIRALYMGQEITSIDQFMGERGAVFVAVRSADW